MMKIILDKNYGTKSNPIKCVISDNKLTYGHCISMQKMENIIDIQVEDINNFRTEAEVQWLLFINGYYFEDGRINDNNVKGTLLLKYDWLSREIILNPYFTKLNKDRRELYVNAIKYFPDTFSVVINSNDNKILKTKTKFMEDNGIIPEVLLDFEF